MRTSDVTVCICTANRCAELADAIVSLVPELGEAELLVVDNGSVDSTADVVGVHSGLIPSGITYVFEEVPGIAHARNRAIQEATGQWIAFIDDDEIAQAGWLSHLLRRATLTGADIVGGRLELDLPIGATAWIQGTARKHLGEAAKGRIRDRFNYSGPGAGNVLVHRKVFAAIGGFDPSLAYRGEDQDFFRRAMKAGFRHEYEPLALVQHRLSPERLSPSALIRTAVSNGRSLSYFDWKYDGVLWLWLTALLRLAHALAVSIPGYLGARLRSDSGSVLSRRCSIRTASAYVTEAIRLTLGVHRPPLRYEGEQCAS